MFSSNTFVATFFFFHLFCVELHVVRYGFNFILYRGAMKFLILNSLIHSVVCLKGWDIISDVSLSILYINVSIFSFQEVNENSLKRLSAYLENLQKPGFKSLKPTQLVFYVRETDQNPSDGQEHFSASGTFLISHVSLAPLQASFGMSSTCLKVARRPLE